MSEEIHCSRCGRIPREDEPLIAGLPEGWEGSVAAISYEAVCPNCQFAEWHPHCTSLRTDSGYGERVDIEPLARGESIVVPIDDVPVRIESLQELEPGTLGRCDYIDLSVSWIHDADCPQEWRCPECGGTQFEGVHRDYGKSGLKGTSFRGELEELDEPDD